MALRGDGFIGVVVEANSGQPRRPLRSMAAH